MFSRKPPFQKQLSWLDSLTVEIQLNIGQQSQLPWLRPSYAYICDMTHPQSPIPSYILILWIVHHFLGCAAKQSTCWGASWCHPVHSCTCATLLSEVMDFHNTLVILVLVGVSMCQWFSPCSPGLDMFGRVAILGDSGADRNDHKAMQPLWRPISLTIQHCCLGITTV